MQSCLLREGFSTVSYAEFWGKINYYGLQSILILFLTKQLAISDEHSYAIYGGYIALSFGFSVLGGIIADKVLGLYHTAMMGCVLIFIGNFILIVSQSYMIYVGLSFIMVGFGLLKPSTPSLIGLLYREDSPERSKAFSIFYVCLNAGSISGPLLYGFFYSIHCYFAAYLSGALGIGSVFCMLHVCRAFLLNRDINYSRMRYGIATTIVASGIVLSCFLLNHPELFMFFFAILFILIIGFLHVFSKRLSDKEKSYLIQLLPPVLSSIIFFAILLQIYSTLTLFIDRYIDKIIFGFQIPTAWFSSVEPIMLLIITPFLSIGGNWLARRNIYVKSKHKFVYGLMMTALSFLIFFIIPNLEKNNHIVSIFLLFFGYFLLAFSELSIIPVSISLANLLAPANYKGIVIGVFYSLFMFSGYLATFIAKWAPPSDASQEAFGRFFLLVSLVTLAAVLLLLLLNILINRTNKYPHKNFL